MGKLHSEYKEVVEGLLTDALIGFNIRTSAALVKKYPQLNAFLLQCTDDGYANRIPLNTRNEIITDVCERWEFN